MASSGGGGIQFDPAELEQEPYDPEEFVERLAWRTATSSTSSSASLSSNPFESGGGGVRAGGSNPFGDPSPDTGDNQSFDARQLNDVFIQSIKDLSIMLEKQHKKCAALEQKCREEELINRKKMGHLMEKNRRTAATYKSLDEKINSVATKVIHLGDQLESVNTPRARDVEALKLMRHFEEFLSGEAALSPIFNDNARLHEAADVILKLQLVAQELPENTGDFSDAVRRIDDKYLEIQSKLIDDFVKSQRSDDLTRMKALASVLFQFKRYNACVDEFIGVQIQSHGHGGAGNRSSLLAGGRSSRHNQTKDIFKDIVPLCHVSWKTISQVFPNPQQVMSKFVLNVYHNKIKTHVDERLEDKKSTENYLTNLFQLYDQTTKLNRELSQLAFNSSGLPSSPSSKASGGGPTISSPPLDHAFLTNQTKSIFRTHLESYINIESKFLNAKCAGCLQRYYEGLGHQKVRHNNLIGGAAASGLQDFKRSTLNYMAAKTSINIEMLRDDGGETFLSEVVAIDLLQLTKQAFKRCQALSSSDSLPNNAREVLGILRDYLLHEHVDYALETGLQGIPLPESRTLPELFFFDVVGQANTIIHLFEKQFSEYLLPLVANTPVHGDVIASKKSELDKLEAKIDKGLDQTLNAVAGWGKTVLTTEQKKTDFNPVSEQTALAATSPACLRVVKFVKAQAEKIRHCLDGKNIELVLLELGLRLHRVIYDHLQNFTYGAHGVMSVICDVQEYRKTVADFKVPAVNTLFDTLHAMCNLLFMTPENLRSATQATDGNLASLDRTILDNWIQLRADYKSKRLGTYL